MKEFKKVNAKNDPVECWVSEDGFYRITKRGGVYTLKYISIFNLLGEEIGRYASLEDAMADA